MKVSYDNDGKILAVARDTEVLTGNVITVPDDEDLILHPGKYYVEVGTQTVVRRPYLEVTTSTPSVPADGTSEITITVERHLGTGELDTDATDQITVQPVVGTITTPPVFTLTDGVGTFTIKSTVVGRRVIICRSDAGAYRGSIAIDFTQP